MIHLYFIFPADGLTIPTWKCTGGWFCTGQSTRAMPVPYSNAMDQSKCSCPVTNYMGGECWPGTYCPAGINYPIACDGGYYYSQRGLATREGQCSSGKSVCCLLLNYVVL